MMSRKNVDWQIVERVKSAFGRGKATDDTQDAESATTQATESTDDDTSATLYKCPECETTYISEEMESCPECGGAVDQRPSAAELGMGSDTR